MGIRMRRLATVVGLLALCSAAVAERRRCGHAACALARVAPRPVLFEESTGRRPGIAAPPRTADLRHLLLHTTIESFPERRARVAQVLILDPNGDTVALDAEGMTIDSVELLKPEALALLDAPSPKIPEEFEAAETKLEWFHDGERLRIAGLPQDMRTVALRIAHRLPAQAGALFWRVPREGDPDPRSEVWTQGASANNRTWFVAHDWPDDFLTTEQFLTVPAPNVAVANGEPLGVKELGDGAQLRYHFRMNDPHATYLTSMVVGQFVRGQAGAGITALDYYVPPQHAEHIERTFGRTPEMLLLFERLFDEPYPTPRYAQVVVRDFVWGGMENIGATTLNEAVLSDAAAEDAGLQCGAQGEPLIAHELAHQWFGNLVTCRSWQHLWLNEGWATYCESLWLEHKCGPQDAAWELWRTMQDVAAADRVDEPQALVWRELPDTESVYGYKDSLVYAKGAAVLHMLRQRLGDEPFFRGTARYLNENAHRSVTTDAFQGALERESGADLELFFRQWVYSPGVPHLTVSLDYEPTTRQAILTVEQTQKVDPTQPAFSGTVAVDIGHGEGVTRTNLSIAERRHRFAIPVPQPPTHLSFDPRGTLLKKLTIAMPPAFLAASARAATGAFAAYDAIDALGRSQHPDAVRELLAIGVDETAHWTRRAAAIRALGAVQTPLSMAALERIAAPAPGDYRLRRALAIAAGKHAPELANRLLRKLATDPADAVAESAVERLGILPPEQTAAALHAAKERGGIAQSLRVAALKALANIHTESALQSAAALLDDPASNRDVRVEALKALSAQLLSFSGDAEPYRVRIRPLLDDPDADVRLAAVHAVGTIGDEDSRPRLEGFAAGADRALAQAAIEALAGFEDRAPVTDPAAIREKLLQLERERKELESRIRKLEAPPEKDEEEGGWFFGLF